MWRLLHKQIINLSRIKNFSVAGRELSLEILHFAWVKMLHSSLFNKSKR
jgi:hypothetical protein